MILRRLLVLALVVGCTAEEGVEPDERPSPDPVVVYVAYEDTTAVRELLDQFSADTGVVIIDRRGPADRIVQDLVDNSVSPPADLLLTRSVVHAWRAAEEGALRPVYSDLIGETVPAWAMDPDRFWFAKAADHAVIAYRGDRPAVSDLADLADESFAGRLCLSSSKNGMNRAVIAMLIESLGTRPAELAVRGWISNLATGPFGSEAELLEAIRSGACEVGVVSASVARRAGVPVLEPASLYADIEAVGVGRHAHNADGAVRLAEWLAARFDATGVASTGARNVGVIAAHYEEAVKLAERARFY